MSVPSCSLKTDLPEACLVCVRMSWLVIHSESADHRFSAIRIIYAHVHFLYMNKYKDHSCNCQQFDIILLKSWDL